MNISGTQSRKYPYGETRVSENERLYRFMDVDLTAFLGEIAGKVILHNHNNWKDDLEKLEKAAMSDDPDDRRLVWLVSGSGTHLNTEYETFIEDTPASKHMTQYGGRPNDLFGYIVEVRGIEDGIIKGNVFEIGDFDDYAWYVRNTALPLDSVTITYTDGRGHYVNEDVPHYEFARDYKQLVGGSAIVSDICYHPLPYLKSMPGLLHKERENRMALPIGTVEAHLAKLSAKLADLRGYLQIPHVRRTPVKRAAAELKPSISDTLKAAEKEVNAYKAQKIKSNNKDINIDR